MLARRAIDDPVTFAAPVGRRVRLFTVIGYVIIGGAVLLNIALASAMRAPPKQFWPMLLAPLSGMLVVVPIHLLAQVRSYRLAQGELQVVRRWRETRFPLDGLQDVETDPKAMERATKLFGNDGLGAITGRFNSSKLGRFEALVTDRARSVVLRWEDRCLVVSPDRPEEFVAEARRRAGLRR